MVEGHFNLDMGLPFPECVCGNPWPCVDMDWDDEEDMLDWDDE